MFQHLNQLRKTLNHFHIHIPCHIDAVCLRGLDITGGTIFPFAMILILILIFVATYLFVQYVLSSSKFDKQKPLPPGPSPRFPLIGNLPQILKYKHLSNHYMFSKLVDKHGPLIYFEYGLRRQLIVQDLQHAKELLTHKDWSNRPVDTCRLFRSFGKELGILLTSGNEVWRQLHRFTTRAIKDFGFGKENYMNARLQEEMDIIVAELDAFTGSNKQPISMNNFFTRSIVGMMWTIITGKTWVNEDPKFQELLRLRAEAERSASARPWWLKAFPFFHVVTRFWSDFKTSKISVTAFHDFLRETINDHRSRTEPEPTCYLDLFLSKLDGGPVFNEEQLIIATMDLTGGAADPAKNIMEMTLYYMISYPEVQAKVQEELDQQLQGRSLTLADKASLPFTEAVLLEVGRLGSVTPVLFRESFKPTEIGGFHVPKGTLASINLWAIHRDPKIWENPHDFLPTRFLNNDNEIINRSKVITFGGGARKCIADTFGHNMLFFFFASLMQRYTFKLGGPAPDQPGVMAGFNMLAPEYKVEIEKRNTTH